MIDPEKYAARFWMKFWDRVRKQDDGCWIWTGSRDLYGYGAIQWHGAPKGTHRLLYEMLVGPVPPGLVLDHVVCDARACCNPAHVRPVTNAENVLRGNGPAAVNARKECCPAGHPYAFRQGGRNPDRVWRWCPTCKNERRRQRYAETGR